MLVTVIAYLCLAAEPTTCIERTVTNEATLMQCGGAFAAQVLPKWMEAEHARLLREGWRLCEDGCYRRSASCDECDKPAEHSDPSGVNVCSDCLVKVYRNGE